MAIWGGRMDPNTTLLSNRPIILDDIRIDLRGGPFVLKWDGILAIAKATDTIARLDDPISQNRHSHSNHPLQVYIYVYIYIYWPSYGIHMLAKFENARTATEPRDAPTRNFHGKYPQLPPGAEILDPKKIPRKYRKIIQKWVFYDCFSVLFWYSRGILKVNSESPEFGAGGVFVSVFVRGKSGSGHLGAM